jgi:hypothetical protein
MDSHLSDSQIQVWEAAILGELGAAETASVSLNAARATAITADIFDSSELDFALDAAFKSLDLSQAAQLVVVDPPYGLFSEDGYDEAPDPEKFAILIKYLTEKVCLTLVTKLYGIHKLVQSTQNVTGIWNLFENHNL